jgi:hypothetical protein
MPKCLASTHVVRICWTVSSSWSQRMHISDEEAPSLLADQLFSIYFFMASQMNILQYFAGAQDFQRGRHCSN